MLCTLEWVGLVPPTAAPFSFEMGVVLVGVAYAFSPDFHVCARANVCVRVSICLFVCGGGFVLMCVQVLMVRVSSDIDTSLPCLYKVSESTLHKCLFKRTSATG